MRRRSRTSLARARARLARRQLRRLFEQAGHNVTELPGGMIHVSLSLPPARPPACRLFIAGQEVARVDRFEAVETGIIATNLREGT